MMGGPGGTRGGHAAIMMTQRCETLLPRMVASRDQVLMMFAPGVVTAGVMAIEC